MTLQTRLMWAVALILAVAFGALELTAYGRAVHDAREELLRTGDHLRNLLMATRRVYHHQFLESGLPLNDDTIGFLPAHAMARISEDFPNWDTSGLSFNNVSDRPRNPFNAADKVELGAMAWFREHPQETVRFTPFSDAAGNPFYLYARPIRVENYCLKCHGERQAAPPTIQELYDTAFDYKVGDLRGILSIKLPAAHLQQRVMARFWEDLTVHLMAFVIFLGGLLLILRRYLHRPMELLARLIRDFGQGRYDSGVSALGDDFSSVADAFHSMADSVDQHQRELAQREGKIRLLLDSSGEGIYSVDRRGICTVCNPRALELLGYSDPQELLGKDVHTLFHHHRGDGSHYPAEACPTTRVMATGEPARVDDEVFWRRDGTPLAVEYLVHPIREEGAVVGVVVNFNDVTERKRAEQALRESESHFHTLVNTIPGVFYTCRLDSDWTMLDLGAEVERLTGHPREEFLNNRVRTYASVIHPEDVRRVEAVVFGAAARGEIYTLEYRVLHADGGMRWVFERGQALEDPQGGRPELLYGVIIDITQRRALEEEMAAAKAAAEAGDRAKSEFLAMMSHEIRTPLNAVVGMSDLLAETPLNTEQRHYLEVAQHAGDALLAVIGDILDLSRIDAGELEINVAPFVLQELVEGAVEVVRFAAEGKGLTLVAEVDAGLPHALNGDVRRLRQVLINLLVNAVKFTDRGGVRLSVGRGGAGEVIFAVDDTGIGIPAEKQEQIFQPFTQVDGSYTRRHGGTGLGLTIVRRVVERMGGVLQLHSEAGRGTRVAFTLALLPAEVPPERGGRDAGVVVEEGGLRILLAEDAPDNVVLIRAYLKASGHRLEVAEEGWQALERFKAGGVDLVLMDMQMPVMDGYEATRAIREWEAAHGLPRTPVIALTAHALKGDEERSLAAGCDRHLTKPIRKQQLLALLAEYEAD